MKTMAQRRADLLGELVKGWVYWVKVKTPSGSIEPVKAAFVGMHPVKIGDTMTELPRWRRQNPSVDEPMDFICDGVVREGGRFVVASRDTFREEILALRAPAE